VLVYWGSVKFFVSCKTVYWLLMTNCFSWPICFYHIGTICHVIMMCSWAQVVNLQQYHHSCSWPSKWTKVACNNTFFNSSNSSNDKLIHVIMYEVLSKSSRNVSEKKSRNTQSLIATVPFKVVPLGAYTTIPTFLPRSEAVLEVLLCQRVQYLLRFGLDLLNGVKSSSFQLDFHLGEEEEVTGG
jgi:hypothetical protein